jgi:tetratricopeptide (TPR) repeat protein
MRFICIIMALALSARAEESPKELYERATAAFALQHYEEAATLYERSFSIRPDPALLYNAAQSHRMGGNKVRALKLYQNYVKLYGNRIPNRAEVERHIMQLKAAIATDEAAANAPPTVPRAVSPEAPRREGETPPAKTPEKPPEPERVAPPPAVTAAVVSAPAPEKPVWKKGWFWGVVVGAVVVVGVGVGLGVGLGTGGEPKDPSPTVGSFQAN